MKKINVLKNKLCKCQEKKPNVATQLNNIREDLPASKMMAMRLRNTFHKKLDKKLNFSEHCSYIRKR